MTSVGSEARLPRRDDARAARGPVGLVLVGWSVLLVAATALLGESVATHGLPLGGPLPPYTLDLGPAPWLVVTLLVAAVVLGVAGSWLAWDALDHGWAPAPRRLLALAALAAGLLVLVPPTSSDDVYSYTAYGRMLALGYDPWTTTPADVGDDPVAREAGEPWRDSASVYGPLATWLHGAVMRVAGGDLRAGVALLSLLGALAFLATALLLDVAAGRDDPRRRRAALLFGLNPLLLLHLVAGAHVDVLLVLTGVAAVLAAARRRPLLAGALAGAAFCVKLSGALVAAGLGWWLRRERRPLATFVLGAVLVAVPAYLAAGGWTTFRQARAASRYVAFSSPWRAVVVPLELLSGPAVARAVVGVLSLAAFAGLVVLLARRLPGAGTPAHAVLVPVLAWLLAATYVLPWYDALAWAPLALLPASRWDRLLLAHTAVLTVAYLPGRTVSMPGPLEAALGAVRGVLAPVAIAALVLVAVGMSWSSGSARLPSK